MKFSQKMITKLSNHDFDFTLGDKIDRDLGYDFIDYSYQDLSKLSYIPKSKESLFEGDYWDRDSRIKWAVQVKPHKLLKAIFHKLDENQINEVYQILFACDQKHIEIWEGDKLPDIYNSSLVHTDSGNLKSCMIQYYDILKYDIYKDHCKAVVLLDSKGKINARALLWLNAVDENDKSITYLDRIYSRTQEDNDKLKQWAIEQGYSYRYNNNQEYFKYLGESEGYHLKIKLIKNCDEYELLPYMDSFKFAERGSDIISTNENDGDIKLENYQTGRPFKLPTCACGCGAELDDDNYNTVNDNRYYEECDSIIYSSRYGENVLSNNSHYNDYVDSVINDDDDDFVETFDGTEVLQSDCVRLEGGDNEGEWCLRHDARRCDVCRNWLHEDEVDCCEVEEEEEEEEIVVVDSLQVELDLVDAG